MIGSLTSEYETHRDLIFDLGMHTALDTKFYLDKGFRVVAVEANPRMVESAREQVRKRDRGRPAADRRPRTVV